MKFSALIGNPISQSISSELYPLIAKEFGVENYVHKKFEVLQASDLSQALSHLVEAGAVGFNVTIPYKTEIIHLLDRVENSAIAMGAVNTVRIVEGELVGFNTDANAAMRCLDEDLRRLTAADHCVIIGSGGAARAVLWSVLQRTKNTSLFCRNREKALEIREHFIQCNLPRFGIFALDDKEEFYEQLLQADFVVQCTSVGMGVSKQESLISESVFEQLALKRSMDTLHILDVVANPRCTRLLRDAENYGCKTCSGINMLVYQAIESMQIWLDKDAPPNIASEVFRAVE